MIKVEKLQKHFGPISALNGITFSIEKGECIGFLGPNGSGKTTTIRILTCFLSPTSGRVEIDGYDVIKDSLEVRRRIGYFPERVPLYPRMRVSTFLDFVASVKGVSRRERKKKIFEAMDRCGLVGVAHRVIGNLSKGYRQRVGLAQVLVNNPPILILDEPTIGLDPEQMVEIRKLIRSLNEDKTIFLSSHILSEVSVICNRVIIINNGRIVAEDIPENLAAKLEKASQFIIKIKGPRSEVRNRLQEIPGVFRVDEQESDSENIVAFLIVADKNMDVACKISSTIFQNDWSLLEMRQLKMDLEEIFLKLMTKKS